MRDVEAQLVHDMRNTAMVLREASAQLHEYRDSLSPTAVEHLTEMLARRSDMLLRLLNDLSTSHLAESGELDLSLQRVSVADICHEVLAEQPSVPGVRITLDVAEDAVAVADPVRVTQVLDNLVTNAVRYGGSQVRVRAARDGAAVHLSVADDGPGVPTEMLGTLFDAYVRGPDSPGHGGSGLGLLIVRQLCEAMSGSIEYDGTHGARFTATFPALPTASTQLGVDVAGAGHSVAFWVTADDLREDLLAFVANGLAAGEAVLVTATAKHHRLLEAALDAVGIDPVAVTESGQYLPLDAESLHTALPRFEQIDHGRFDSTIGGAVERVRARWRRFRVFGEIVDLYWRQGDDHLALELETCWNSLRARTPFPLLCGYELAPGEDAGAICDCHDLVVSA
jgi:two-component sensor histidine kinase